MGKPQHWDIHGTLCVLSVDDDQVNQMVIESMLRPQGWRIVSAQDGEEAVEQIDAEDTWPDIVLLDFQLGAGETGEQVCKRLREIFQGTPVPVIICSAMGASSPAYKDCLKAGATDFIPKPYEREAMLSIVRKYCGKKCTAKSSNSGNSPLSSQLNDSAPHEGFEDPIKPGSTQQHQQQHQQHGHAHSNRGSQQGGGREESSASPEEELTKFFASIDLEYCGMKLAQAGVTMDSLDTLDESSLRKAGIVVKSQRERILAHIFSH